MLSDKALRAIYTALHRTGTQYRFKNASAFYKKYIHLEKELQENLAKHPKELHDSIIQNNYDIRIAVVRGLFFNSQAAFDTVYQASVTQLANKLRGNYSRERSLELADEVLFIIKRLIKR